MANSYWYAKQVDEARTRGLEELNGLITKYSNILNVEGATLVHTLETLEDLEKVKKALTFDEE